MVKKNDVIVTWDKRAYQLLEKAHQRIKEDSPINADKVKEDIFTVLRSLPANPEKYPRDKYKRNNPGNYRVFEKHNFRIAYSHTTKEIKILRFRSVKQEPKLY